MTIKLQREDVKNNVSTMRANTLEYKCSIIVLFYFAATQTLDNFIFFERKKNIWSPVSRIYENIRPKYDLSKHSLMWWRVKEIPSLRYTKNIVKNKSIMNLIFFIIILYSTLHELLWNVFFFQFFRLSIKSKIKSFYLHTTQTYSELEYAQIVAKTK
mgnify:CR=1 FL=1